MLGAGNQNMVCNKGTTLRKPRRFARGSMIVLCLILLEIVVCVMVAATSVYFLFYSKNRQQYQAETVVLRLAQQLDFSDYAGRMNNLIGHSRELVFTARQMYSKTQDDSTLSELAPLAAQVLDGSRAGAKLVEQERDRLADLTILNLRTIVKELVDHPASSVTFIDLSAYDPEILDIQVGCLKNMSSNVEVSRAIPELLEYDLGKGYIQRGKTLDYYCANVNLGLPSDPDLKFVLSPLLAPIKETTAPARLSSASAEFFQTCFSLRKDGQNRAPIGKAMIPCAAQVTTAMQLKENRLGWLKGTARAVATACTNGASPEPQ